MRLGLIALCLVIAGLGIGAGTMVRAHQRENLARARDLTGGDPDRGKDAAPRFTFRFRFTRCDCSY